MVEGGKLAMDMIQYCLWQFAGRAWLTGKSPCQEEGME